MKSEKDGTNSNNNNEKMKKKHEEKIRIREGERAREREITWGESVGKVFIKCALALAPQDEHFP